MTEPRHPGTEPRHGIAETIAHAPHGHGGAHPPAEEDRIPSKAVVFVGVGALIVFFVASLVAIASMKRQQRELLPDGPAPLPAELGQAKIGIIEQRLFENSNQAASLRAAQERKLGTYGWVDPARGVVRIPVDRAVQMVLDGARPEPSPAPPGGAGELQRTDVGTGAAPPTSAAGANRPPERRGPPPSQGGILGGSKE